VTGETFWCDWPRDFVIVSGADAHAYLNSQLSQDISALEARDSNWSFLLQPNGKIDALVRVTRTEDEAFVVDVDGGFGAAALIRLDRFRIRVKVELEPLSWRCLAVRGPDAADAADAARTADERTLAVVSWWHDPGAADLIGPDPAPPMGVPGADRTRMERERIVAGWPALGAELTERTIPGETGPLLDVAVSFTKGCYPGQELVERMDSRHSLPPRLLRRVRATGGDLAPGATIAVEGQDVGTVTSAVGADGLALIARAIEPGTPGEIGRLSVSISPLR
jgi:folate-binding protein YgfZ